MIDLRRVRHPRVTRSRPNVTRTRDSALMRERRPELVIRGAARILTGDESWTELVDADIVIDGGRITAIGPHAAADIAAHESDIDGSGRAAIPGMVNAHFHSPGNFMKGAVPSLPLELFMLYEVPPFMTSPVSERYAYMRTMLGAVDMLKQGVTAVHDDAYYLPIATKHEIDAVLSAYETSGMRATVAIDQPNVVEYAKHAYFAEQLSPQLRAEMDAAPRQSDGELVDLYHWFLDRWHGRGGGRIRGAVSCSAPHRVTPTYLKELELLSAAYDIPYNMHILESRSQRVFGDQTYGTSLVQYARAQGILSERAHVIHAIWIDDEDIATLAGEGVKVAHNPTCNLRLGSGIMPLRQLIDAGVSIGIGTDEANTDDGVNFWSAVKNAGLVHNLTSTDYEQWPTPEELLRAATTGGHASLRTPGSAGRLTVGSVADVVLMNLHTLPFTPLNDLTRQLVYCEPARTVHTVIVDGEVVVHDGVCTKVDESSLLVDVAALAPEIDAFLADCARGAERAWTLYDHSYRAGLSHPVPMNRRLN
jgi:5-methylthioadenosine/S-adenosylhomocysteine deaminase